MTKIKYLVNPNQKLLRFLSKFSLMGWSKPHLFSIDPTDIGQSVDQATLETFIKVAFLLRMLSYGAISKERSNPSDLTFGDLFLPESRSITLNDFEQWWWLEPIEKEESDLETLLQIDLRHAERLSLTGAGITDKEVDTIIRLKQLEAQGDASIREVIERKLTYIVAPATFSIRPRDNLLQLLASSPVPSLAKVQIWQKKDAVDQMVHHVRYMQTVKITFMLHHIMLAEEDESIKHIFEQIFGENLRLDVNVFDQWWDVEYLKHFTDLNEEINMVRLSYLNRLAETGIEVVDNWIDRLKREKAAKQ